MAKKILVADDDADILALISARLTQMGYEVIRAEDGAQALEKTRQHKPDLLILDYFLPSLKGDGICKAVKDDAALRHIPVIILSASMATLSAETIRAIPCDERLTKPFEMPALLAMIARLLPRT